MTDILRSRPAARPVNGNVPRAHLQPGTSDARRRAGVLVGVVVLLLAIHVSYQFVVSPRYSYQKLTYTTPNIGIYAIMLALLIGLAMMLPIRLTRPGDFLLWTIYVLVVIPSLTISYLARTVSDGTQVMLGLVISSCFAGAILAGRLPARRLGQRIRPLSVRAFWICVIAFSAVTYLALAASGSLQLSLPGLNNVYAVRSAFVSANAANKLLAYAMPNQANVINPLILAVGILTRRWWMVALALVGELLLYGAAGHKSVLFAVPALLVVAWVFRGGRRPSSSIILWGFAGIIVVSAVADQILHSIWLSSLFTRRFIDVPGLLTGAWVNVFGQIPQAHFAYGFLSPFLTYPYAVAPPFVVANVFFGQSGLNANANLFADGYANFGWAGMAFEAALFLAVVVLVNALGRRLPLQAAVLLLVMPAVALSNASMLTSLLTHGVVLLLLVMALAPPALWIRKPQPAARAAARAPVRARSAPTPERALEPERVPDLDTRSGSVPTRAPTTLSWWQRAKLTDADVVGTTDRQE